jgi:hypothetical protein
MIKYMFDDKTDLRGSLVAIEGVMKYPLLLNDFIICIIFNMMQQEVVMLIKNFNRF